MLPLSSESESVAISSSLGRDTMDEDEFASSPLLGFGVELSGSSHTLEIEYLHLHLHCIVT